MESLNWLLMVLQTNFYLICWLLIHIYVNRYGPIPQARIFTNLNSWFYSAVSLGMLGLILIPSHEDLAKRVYHYSKFYEYVDVLGVRAGGGEIDLHFAVHHLTTPYLTFVRVLNHSYGWRTFGALNAAHHFLLYAFFAGYNRLRPVLLATGAVQLIVGIVREIQILELKKQHQEQPWPNIVSLGLLSTYLVLWGRDLLLKETENVQTFTAGKKAYR
jgi:hypothetical protein